MLQVCDSEMAAMHSCIDTVLRVDSMESAPAQLTDYLRGIGAEHWRIGVQRRRPGLNPDTEMFLRVALPSACVINASDLVPALRAVKSEAALPP